MGYQCVFVLFRGTGGMPIQTDKMYHLLSWRDIKEPTDYLHEKYCKSQGRRMYLYGVSLGGGILMHYMLNDAAASPYSAVVTYGTPMCTDGATESFKNRMWGLYDFGLGYNLNRKSIRPILP